MAAGPLKTPTAPTLRRNPGNGDGDTGGLRAGAGSDRQRNEMRHRYDGAHPQATSHSRRMANVGPGNFRVYSASRNASHPVNAILNWTPAYRLTRATGSDCA